MTQAISRRSFVRRAALVAAAVPAASWRMSGWLAAAPAPLRIGVLSSSAPSDATTARTLGIQLGVDEARHAAALFGGSLELVPVTSSTLAERELSAVVGGDDLESCVTLIHAVDAAGIAFMNVGCANEMLRGADCRATTFHVIPSDSMYRDALKQSQAPAGSTATAWDPSLTRFGADTLNERFRAQFKRTMTADAWLGWLAVKILWESSLRARSTDARMLMHYMARDGVQFDGHKGRPLSFRAWDHQLRQPVYVVEASAAAPARPIREMPASEAADVSRDVLDRLGTPAARSACRMSP
jgi:hypothetical protein